MGGRVARGPRHAVGLEPVGESLIRGARRDPCDVASGRRRVLRSGTSNRNTFASRLFARGVSRVVDGPGPGPRRRRRIARRLQHRLVSLYVQGKSRYDTRAGFSFVFQDTKLSCVFASRVARRSDAISSVALTARESSSERLGSSHCCAAAGGTYAPPPCPSEGFPSGTP